MKITNDLLKEAVELREALRKHMDKAKPIQDRLADLEAAIKANGTVATREFVAVVSETQVERLVGKEQFFEYYSKEALERQGLIKTSAYMSVKISRKATG